MHSSQKLKTKTFTVITFINSSDKEKEKLVKFIQIELNPLTSVYLTLILRAKTLSSFLQQ